MRTSYLRLERRKTLDGNEALTLLQRSYETLAEAVVVHGRQHGYLGQDPHAALTHLDTEPPGSHQLCVLIQELWQVFFTGFRPDEVAFEAVKYQEAAEAIDRELRAIPTGEAASLELCQRMVDLLTAFWGERQDELHRRLDDLIGQLGEHQAKLGSSELTQAYQADSMGRTRQLLQAVLRELGLPCRDDDQLEQLLSSLITFWRGELSKRSTAYKSLQHEQRSLMQALQAAVRLQPLPDLPKELYHVAEAIGDLAHSHREQEQQVRQLEREHAAAQAQIHLEQELQTRNELLARYEFGEADRRDEDGRLELYRQAAKAWRAGKDPEPQLEAIRQLEQVLHLDATAQQQAVALLDQHLATLATSLGQAYGQAPIIDDPKRFRPRLLGSSAYKFKTVIGQIQAGRDIARDVYVLVGRARWAYGVEILRAEFKKLRSVFKEMVGLVGDCREQIGGAPMLSVTINVSAIDGMAALPMMLATDIHTLLRSRKVHTVAGDIPSSWKKW